jgi:transcriptional regulator with XRE-family HTH domain
MDAITSLESLEPRKLRGLLAEQQITHVEFAQRCKLSRPYISRILSGAVHPGELARIKLARGLAALGLDRQAGHAA